MKILVVSDSHRADDIIKKIALKHNDCDYYLHLGDSQSNKESIYPFISVRGNCDFFSSEFEISKLIKTPFGNIYLEHIPFNTTDLVDLKKKNVKIYLHGHTHKKKDVMMNGIRIINPGSISYCRDNYNSYCIIELDNNIKVNFYKVEEI